MQSAGGPAIAAAGASLRGARHVCPPPLQPLPQTRAARNAWDAAPLPPLSSSCSHGRPNNEGNCLWFWLYFYKTCVWIEPAIPRTHSWQNGEGGRTTRFFATQTFAIFPLSVIVGQDLTFFFSSDFCLTPAHRMYRPPQALSQLHSWTEIKGCSQLFPLPVLNRGKEEEALLNFIRCTGGGEFRRRGLGDVTGCKRVFCSVLRYKRGRCRTR